MAPMASVTMVMVVTMVMADTDLTSDMRELRGELDQLRSEVTTQKCLLSIINKSIITTQDLYKPDYFCFML